MPKILAIDDHQDHLMTLAAVLKSLIPDCSLVTAPSGVEGLKKAREELPDTILLDIRLPEMDGFEVCKRLKSSEKTQHIPVIMVTAARMDPESRLKGLALGADAFLTKPIVEAELAAQVNVTLRIKKAEDFFRKERVLLEDLVRERTAALRESEERYRNLVDRVNDGIVIVQDEIMLYVNQRFAQMTGHAVKELTGAPFTDCLCTQEVPKVVKLGGVDDRAVYKTALRHRHGGRRDVEINTGTINYQGKPSELVVIRDLTALRRMEARCRQTQKMEAICALAGGIAHDFNNILGAIAAYTEMSLLDVMQGHVIKHYLEQVLKAVNRAKDLVKQILALSRQSEQEKQSVNAVLIIKEVLRLLRASMPSTIKIKRHLAAKSGVIQADPTQIYQVLMDLCANAKHAMREKGGVLSVSLTDMELNADGAFQYPDLSPGPYLKLEVGDTGRGLDQPAAEKFFKPSVTPQTMGEGPGKGLSVVYGIVKDLGGDVKVHSRPGTGCAFQVLFPKFNS